MRNQDSRRKKTHEGTVLELRTTKLTFVLGAAGRLGKGAGTCSSTGSNGRWQFSAGRCQLPSHPSGPSAHCADTDVVGASALDSGFRKRQEASAPSLVRFPSGIRPVGPWRLGRKEEKGCAPCSRAPSFLAVWRAPSMTETLRIQRNLEPGLCDLDDPGASRHQGDPGDASAELGGAGTCALRRHPSTHTHTHSSTRAHTHTPGQEAVLRGGLRRWMARAEAAQLKSRARQLSWG